MSDIVDIRIAEPADYARVGELTIASYRALPVDHLFGGYGDEILDVATRAKSADVLVAVDHGSVVGAVTLVLDPQSPWLEWTEPDEVQFRLLAVDSAARGRGVGEALVRECVARAGNRSVLIHTTRWMDAAQRLYTRLGFTRRPDRDVPQDVWYDPERDVDLSREWEGATFLAYAGPQPERSSA